MSTSGTRGMMKHATTPAASLNTGSSSSGRSSINVGQQASAGRKDGSVPYFQMPLHYPRYTRADYKTMPEWKLDCLLKEYGLPLIGDVEQKREFAMGSFLWS